MKRPLALLYILLVPLTTFGQDQPQEHLVAFEWKYNSWLYGTLRVPSGYKEETRNYTEGIVTYLHYPDSSYIILQRGGMFRIPMLQGEEYLEEETRDLSDRTVRRGRIDKTDLLWGEMNFKRKKITGRKLRLLDLFPPNIGFNRVPKDRGELFRRALESFVEQSRKVASNNMFDRSAASELLNVDRVLCAAPGQHGR